MGKTIVTTGRGGTGKSTFVSLAARYLPRPLLLIDIDPDQSLAEMLGIDLQKEGKRTVLDVLFDIQKKRGYESLGSMALPDKIEFLFNSECVYESRFFDLVSLGVKWTEGCYCAPNNLLRGILPRLTENYTTTLIDAPAGLEHLNRKVTSEIDHLFVVLDPSMKALRNAERIRKLTKEIGIRYARFYLIANYRFTEGLEKVLPENETYLGKIEQDPDVEAYNVWGKSLLELPEDSPAAVSVRKILAKAGYATSSLTPEAGRI